MAIFHCYQGIYLSPGRDLGEQTKLLKISGCFEAFPQLPTPRTAMALCVSPGAVARGQGNDQGLEGSKRISCEGSDAIQARQLYCSFYLYIV